jgi:hypothetical protein
MTRRTSVILKSIAGTLVTIMVVNTVVALLNSRDIK